MALSGRDLEISGVNWRDWTELEGMAELREVGLVLLVV